MVLVGFDHGPLGFGKRKGQYDSIGHVEVGVTACLLNEAYQVTGDSFGVKLRRHRQVEGHHQPGVDHPTLGVHVADRLGGAPRSSARVVGL